MILETEYEHIHSTDCHAQGLHPKANICVIRFLNLCYLVHLAYADIIDYYCSDTVSLAGEAKVENHTAQPYNVALIRQNSTRMSA